MKGTRITYLILLFLSALFLFDACTRDRKTGEEYARDKFYELMKEWYLWYREMPDVNTDDYATAEDLLEALLYRPRDKWSYISTREEFEQYYNTGEYIGYGFGYFFDTDQNIWISYVFGNSPLVDLGITRGWRIVSVDGTAPATASQLKQLLGPDRAGISRTIEFLSPDGTTITQKLTKRVMTINSILFSDTLHVNNKVVGYLVLQAFIEPTIDELRTVIENFSLMGTEDLIVDLRYNGGGRLDVTLQLASMITGPSLINQVFITMEFNDKHTSSNETIRFIGADNDYDLPVPVQLALPRLILITSESTASASEALINGLEPYLDIITIGKPTHGKPVGMNAWFYDDYAFVPVTFKLMNANGDGDYFNGLPVDSEVPDNPASPFGDRHEACLQEAIYFLQTGSFTGSGTRKSAPVKLPAGAYGLKSEIGAL